VSSHYLKESSLFVDFMTFYFTKTYFTLMLTKKLQLDPPPGLCRWTPLGDFRPQTPYDPATSPPIMETDRRLCLFPGKCGQKTLSCHVVGASPHWTTAPNLKSSTRHLIVYSTNESSKMTAPHLHSDAENTAIVHQNRCHCICL